MADVAGGRLGAGRYYYANDSESVPRIFTSETILVARTLVEEHTFVPNVRQDHEVLRGIEPQELPPLRGYVLAYPKPAAEVLLVSDKADPVLAVWRYGLGARQPSPLICAGGGRHGLNGRTSANLPVSSCVGPSVRRCVKTCG